MAKFVIECPNCGKYAEATAGIFGTTIFGTKKIGCTCGYTIDIKTDKLASRTCPYCGNNVIYDQSKGEEAICPVCHSPINMREDMDSFVDFTCPACSCRLSAEKDAISCTCPLCNTKINVRQQIAKESVKAQGLANVIKCGGGDGFFVWKHPIEDFNLGSQLIVHESQEAIFFKDGRALDLFGAGRYTLAGQTLPCLDELYRMPDNADTVFHSEVYFVNMATQMGIKWGTDSKVRLFDPVSGLHVELGACGNFNLRVSDSKKLLLKAVGTASELAVSGGMKGDGCSTDQMVGKFRALIMNKVKSNLARAIKDQGINVLEIDEHLDALSERIKALINGALEEYGLSMPEFYITTVATPDDDPNFRRLKQQFAERTLRVRDEEIREAEAKASRSRHLVEAETEAQLKMLQAQGEAEALKIKAQAEAEAYKAQAYAEAEEMRAKGYTYQQETSRQVGVEAMRNGVAGNVGGAAFGSIAEIGAGISNGIHSNDGIPGDVDTWDCSCGLKKIKSKFCPECGAKKPEPPETWDCSCGLKGIKSKFCPECGAKKPEPPETWDCSCGTKGITSKFCPECGCRRGED